LTELDELEAGAALARVPSGDASGAAVAMTGASCTATLSHVPAGELAAAYGA